MRNGARFTELHRALVIRYDLEEMRTLCAKLGVDYDNLRGEGKDSKSRELILWLDRRSRLGELVTHIQGDTLNEPCLTETSEDPSADRKRGSCSDPSNESPSAGSVSR